MRHFNHHIGDYAAATQHLSFVEDAAYHRMMRLYYQTEKPLLSDLKALARVLGARTKEEKEAVATVANEFFTLEADGWHQRRCDAEIERYREKSFRASEAGRKGGRPRRNSKPLENNETGKADASKSESEPIANEKPTTQPSTLNPQPISKKENLAERSRPVAEAASQPPDDDLEFPAELRRPWPAERAQPIGEEWLPSEGVQAQLAKSRPDLTAETIQRRMVEFRAWCAESRKTTFNPDATWLNFMVKTHVEYRQGHSRNGDAGIDPIAEGVRQSLARRSVLAGG